MKLSATVFPALVLLLTLSTCVPAQIAAQSRIGRAFSKSYQDSLRAELDPETEPVYRVNKWVSGGIIAAGIYANTVGLTRLREKEQLNDATLDRLANDRLPAFDRWGLRQDADGRLKGESASDRVFQVSAVLPLTLFVKRKFRKDWLDISFMYIETQMLASNWYTYGPFGPTFVERYRPMAYYEELSRETRNSGNNRNSFFSGHVSSTATGVYFFTKVLSDYNPQWTGGQRFLAFGLAAVPPLYVSVQRVRALKHFPSDCVVGLGVGAFFGTMVPNVHKWWQQRHPKSRLTVSGSYGDSGGGVAGMVLTF